MSFGSGSPSLKVEGQGTEAERRVVLLVAVFRRGIVGWRREKSNTKDDRVEARKLEFLYRRGKARVAMLKRVGARGLLLVRNGWRRADSRKHAWHQRHRAGGIEFS